MPAYGQFMIVILVSYDDQASLLSSLEQPYLFDIFRQGEGQILWTEKMIHDDTMHKSLQNGHLSMQKPMKN